MEHMKTREYSYFKAEMDTLSLEGKRNEILRMAQEIQNGAKEKGFQYAPLEELTEWVCYIMNWVTIGEGYSWSRRVSYTYPLTKDPRAMATISNMARKGYIVISNTGKGFKLKTKEG